MADWKQFTKEERNRGAGSQPPFLSGCAPGAHGLGLIPMAWVVLSLPGTPVSPLTGYAIVGAHYPFRKHGMSA